MHSSTHSLLCTFSLTHTLTHTLTLTLTHSHTHSHTHALDSRPHAEAPAVWFGLELFVKTNVRMLVAPITARYPGPVTPVFKNML